VTIAALGIDPNAASHRISYTVGSAGYYTAPGSTNGLIDSVDTPLSFDALAPGYSIQGGGNAALGYAAKPGTALAASAAQDTVLGLLALEHHNASGNRAGVVKITAGPPASVAGAGQPGLQSGRQPIGVG
jgi:hypothetical protein